MANGNKSDQRQDTQNHTHPPQDNVRHHSADEPSGETRRSKEQIARNTDNQLTLERIFRSLASKRGGLVGAMSYIFGYFVTLILISIDSGADIGNIISEFGASKTTVVGWIFYGAHYTPLEISAGRTLRSANILSGSTLAIPKVVYFAVPVVILAIGGYLVVSQTSTRDSNDAFIRGASVVVGYVPLMFIGTFVFTTVVERQSVDVIYGLSTGTAIIAGAFMAVIIGGIGGYAVN